MHTYDLPYTRRAISIHFQLLRTHEDRGHILYIYTSFFWPMLAFQKTSIFPHVEELSIPVLTGSDSHRGGLSPPPGPMNQIHYCHSIVKDTSLDSINKLIIQLKNESLSCSLL